MLEKDERFTLACICSHLIAAKTLFREFHSKLFDVRETFADKKERPKYEAMLTRSGKLQDDLHTLTGELEDYIVNGIFNNEEYDNEETKNG